MRPKKIIPKILLLAGFVALFFIIKYQSQVKDIIEFNLETIKINFYNTFYKFNSDSIRKSPLSTLKEESQLKLYIGAPFTGFNQEEWDKFWDIIYDVFPLEYPGKEGLPKKVRQLSDEEIREELRIKYPNPFSYFKEQHWQMFFSIILKRR